VKIKGSAITRAFFVNNENGIPHLVINTKDKYVKWYEREIHNDRTRFLYKNNSYVDLIAESKQDIDILHSVMFDNHVKDQKIILFLDKI